MQAIEVWQAEELVLEPAKPGYRLTDSRREEPLLTVAMESRVPFHLNTHVSQSHLMCLCVHVHCVLHLTEQVGCAAVWCHSRTAGLKGQLA